MKGNIFRMTDPVVYPVWVLYANDAVHAKKSLTEIHIAVVLFGTAGLFGKWLLLSPFLIVLGRVFFASIALAMILAFSKQGFQISRLRDGIILFFLGALLAGHWVCFFQSIQVSTVAVGLLSYSSFPLFTSFLEPLFFKERLVLSNVIFALFCILGVFLIIPRFDTANSIFQGVLWGLAAGLTFSILTILNHWLAQRISYLQIAFYQDLSATLFLLPFLIWIPLHLNTKNLALLIVLGVLCTAAAHSLFIKGMRQVKAQTAAIISALEPVYGILLAILLLKEMPSLRTILGGAVILCAAIAVTARR